MERFDAALEACVGTSVPGRKKVWAFCAVTLELATGRHHEAAADSVDALFDTRLSKDQRRTVAFALLRLLACCPALFDDPRLAGKSDRLFDDSLPDIYKALNISSKDQSFERRQVLADVMPRALQDVQDAVAAARSAFAPDAIATAQRDYLTALKRHRPLFAPFVPREVLASLPSDLFAAVRGVLEAPDVQFLARYHAAAEQLDSATSLARSYGGRFAAVVLGELASELRSKIDSLRSGRNLAHAVLQLSATGKRYPFHDDGRPARLALAVRNTGEGIALDAALSVEAISGFVPDQLTLYVGTVSPGSMVVELGGLMDADDYEKTGSAELIGSLTWRNSDGTDGAAEFEITLSEQRRDIDWDAVSADAYSLKAIKRPEDLIGREQSLSTLLAGLESADMTSAMIIGQKRVGKTSIARSLQTAASEQVDNLAVGYLQVSPYRASPALLYRAIATELIAAVDRAGFEISAMEGLLPAFDEGFVEILGLVQTIKTRVPKIRLALILDEFDEIPSALYAATDAARAFFNTLRDLVADEQFSLLLVGGERLPFVLSIHGSALNLLAQHRVDYFRRSDQMADYSDLVRRPTAHYLDVHDDAVAALYDLCAGHPYFTKMICRTVAATARSRRDASITRREVDEAVEPCLAEAAFAAFQHFWDDGVLETDEAHVQSVIQQRRLVLLAVARAMRRLGSMTPSVDQVEAEAKQLGVTDAEFGTQIRSFEQRNVLHIGEGRLAARVPFFARWLRDYGVGSIVTSMTDRVIQAKLEQELADAVVTPEEVTTVVKRWGLYRGRQVTTDQLRAWLKQFGDDIDQRRAFDLVRQLRFVSAVEIHEALATAHRSIVMKGRERRLERGQQTYTDVLVVPLDDPGKSGWQYGGMYAMQNRIHKGNVVDRGRLAHRLTSTTRTIQTVVFVDDFIGTGQHVLDRFDSFDEPTWEAIRTTGVDVVLVIVLGFQDALARIEEWIAEHHVPVRVACHDMLSESDRAFSSVSKFFENDVDKATARELFLQIGRQIDPKQPLGYGDLQALVAFETSVPNNTLSPIWGSSTGGFRWEPLFSRI